MLKDRLKIARKNARKSQLEVAEAIGITQSAYSQLETGRVDSSSHLSTIAKFLGVDSYWLQTGDGAPNIDLNIKQLLDGSPNIKINTGDNREENIWIDLVNIRFSCGDGESIEFHFDEVLEQYEFKPSFFKKHGVKPENMKLALATGDSQEPYICTGDIFGIDLTDKDVRDGEFYAVYFEGEAMLKQIFKEEGGRLILHSLNPKYRDKTVSDINGANFRVIGRQFYRAG